MAVEMFFRRNSSEQAANGFTLVETLLAIFFLSLALLGTAALLDSVIAKNLLANQITTATTLAQDKIEELKNTDSLTSGSLPPPSNDRFTWEWTVTSCDPDPGMSTVSITVSWYWRDKPRNVVLKTYVVE